MWTFLMKVYFTVMFWFWFFKPGIWSTVTASELVKEEQEMGPEFILCDSGEYISYSSLASTEFTLGMNHFLFPAGQANKYD